MQVELEYLRRGDDPGADVLASYTLRGDFDSRDSSFLSGDILSKQYSTLCLNYYLSSISSLLLKVQSGGYTELGVSLNW